MKVVCIEASSYKRTQHYVLLMILLRLVYNFLVNAIKRSNCNIIYKRSYYLIYFEPTKLSKFNKVQCKLFRGFFNAGGGRFLS